MPGPDRLSLSQRVFLFLALGLIFLHAALLLAVPSYHAVPLLSNLIQIACPLVTALACISAARQSTLFARHFWLLAAGGFSVWAIAQTIATYYDSILHADTQAPWPSDIIFFLSMLLPTMTLLIDPKKGFEWKQWPRFFDLAQVVIVSVAACILTFETPDAWRNGWGTIGQFAWIPEIFRDSLLLTAFTIAGVWGRNKAARQLYGRLAVYFLVYLSCEFPYLYLQSTHNLRTGSPWDLAWTFPFVVATVLVVSSQPRPAETISATDSADEPRPLRRWALAHVASILFPILILLMAAGIAQKQLLMASVLVVLSFGCSVARIIFAEQQQSRSARELRESNALLQSVFEGTGDALFVKDLEGRYVIVNQTFASLIDLNVAEVTGKIGSDLVNAELARQLTEQDREVIASGTAKTFEYEASLNNGTHIFLTNKAPRRDAVGNVVGIIGVVRDITDYRQMEERLRQSQKMEAIGTLAGGVAHDFNNLLMVMNGYSAVLAEALAAEPTLRAHVEQILNAGERAASLTGQLLAFSRKQTIQLGHVNLNDVIAGVEKLLHRLIGEDLKISVRLTPDLGAILADSGQMEQVILNLAVNARDAMPDGGELTFETRNVELGDSIARANNLNPGRYIEFLVRDTGKGMPLNVQTHLFEPFFTTKPAGKGTGLGLFTVYGIVKQYNGHITFTSQPDRGTTFRIFLPRIDSAKALLPVPAEIDPVQRGQETVLLVEDDLAVCELIRSVLTAHGYKVVTAVRPGDAEKLFHEIGNRVDLLVSDVVMPDVSGTELARRLVARNPAMKVLFMSGYIGDAVARAGIQEKDVGFLQKPFTPLVLVRKVREVLDGTRVREG